MKRIELTCRLATELVVPNCSIHVPSEQRAISDIELASVDAIVCLLSDRVDRSILERAPKLTVVANYAVGVDNIDLRAATELGVCVLNTPDVLTDATAELAIALMFAVARNLAAGHHLVAGGQWQGWSPTLLLGVPLSGRLLGIIGMGRIGRAVARRALGLGMAVGFYGGAAKELAGQVKEFQSIDELCAASDVISLHCPALPQTHQVINRERLALVKPGTILINTARGGCIDEQAVLAALDSGRLFGAGLDVFTNEPAVNPAIAAHPKVTCAPHLGSATTQARSTMVHLLATGMTDVFALRKPANLVNHEVWGREAWSRRQGLNPIESGKSST